MDFYEEAVLYYIASSSKRFINPQFNLAYDSKKDIGGSLPDFVVLDFEDRTVYIIEVTKAYDIKNLLSKVSEREKRWILPIKETIDSNFSEWDYHVTLFLREDRVKHARDKLAKNIDVSVISLKNINCFLGDGEFEGKNSLKN